MFPLAATLVLFKAALDSPSVAQKDKGQVGETGDYLTKWLDTVSILVDKSIPIVVALCEAIPYSEGGRWRGPGKTILFNIAHALT